MPKGIKGSGKKGPLTRKVKRAGKRGGAGKNAAQARKPATS